MPFVGHRLPSGAALLSPRLTSVSLLFAVAISFDVCNEHRCFSERMENIMKCTDVKLVVKNCTPIRQVLANGHLVEASSVDTTNSAW